MKPLQWLLFSALLNCAAVPVRVLSQMIQKLIPQSAPRQVTMLDEWPSVFPRAEQACKVSSQLCCYTRLKEEYEYKKHCSLLQLSQESFPVTGEHRLGTVLVCSIATVTPLNNQIFFCQFHWQVGLWGSSHYHAIHINLFLLF